jgi:phage tail-like protein
MSEYQIPVGFRFKVEFEGIPNQPFQNPDTAPSTSKITGDVKDARFQEVTGLNMELGVETLEEGGINTYAHRLPGRGKFENLVLKRGLLLDTELKHWIKDAIENFLFTPSTVTVYLLNENQTALASWQFLRAWPVKWSVSDFKAQENALVVETLELAYANFIYKKV